MFIFSCVQTYITELLQFQCVIGDGDAAVLAIIKNKEALDTLSDLEDVECKVVIDYFHMKEGTIITDATSPVTVAFDVSVTLHQSLPQKYLTQ